MPVDLALRVAAQEDLGAAHFLLTLDTEGAVPAWLPGQFAMLATCPRPDQNGCGSRGGATWPVNLTAGCRTTTT